MKKIVGLFFFCVIAFANDLPERTFLSIKVDNKSDIQKIADITHIESIIDGTVYIIVNPVELQLLHNAFPQFYRSVVQSYVLRKPALDLFNVPENEEAFPPQDAKYHTYQQMVDLLKDLARNHPHIVELFSIGKSVEGRDIWAIRLTHQKNRTSGAFVPGIVFTGSHHAREHLSTEVPLITLKKWVESYDKVPELQNLIDHRDIYFIPMVNPDGAMYDIVGKRYKYWRKNRTLNYDKTYGVDLNRNYSYGWGTGGSSKVPSSEVYMGELPFSEPETIAIRDFVKARPNLRIFLSFHTYSELILYPWGGRNDGIGGEDELIHKTMAETMAQWNGYTPQQSSELYIASGDTCDWAYGDHGIYCFTFELTPKGGILGSGFYPGVKVIDSTVAANQKPMLYLTEVSSDPKSVLSTSWRLD